ncbi:hypothetical protein [Limosilactobacillus vaginalis]
MVKLAKQAVEKNLTVPAAETALPNGTEHLEKIRRGAPTKASLCSVKQNPQLQSKFRDKGCGGASQKKYTGKIEISFLTLP